MKNQIQITRNSTDKHSVPALTINGNSRSLIMPEIRNQSSAVEESESVDLTFQSSQSQQIIPRKESAENVVLHPMQINSTVGNCADTDKVSESAVTSSATGSGMIIQLDNSGRVVPVQTTAVHVVDCVPYYPSPDPIQIIIPPQTVVVTGYDNIAY